VTRRGRRRNGATHHGGRRISATHPGGRRTDATHPDGRKIDATHLGGRRIGVTHPDGRRNGATHPDGRRNGATHCVGRASDGTTGVGKPPGIVTARIGLGMNASRTRWMRITVPTWTAGTAKSGIATFADGTTSANGLRPGARPCPETSLRENDNALRSPSAAADAWDSCTTRMHQVILPQRENKGEPGRRDRRLRDGTGMWIRRNVRSSPGGDCRKLLIKPRKSA